MKRLFLALILLPSLVQAQFGNYYDSALGLNGQPLRQALHDIIKNNTNIGYAALWTVYQTSDKKANGKVWDIYSDNPGQTPPYEFTFVADQCGTYNNESDCYNREHTIPESYFGASEPTRSDLLIVFPTDGFVNNKRSNFAYGKVSNPTWTSQNGSKLGPNVYSGAPNTTAFEPIDSFKGDLARTYFYYATRYYSLDAGWSNWDMAVGAELKPWAVQMLLEWHQLDPVSQKEKLRNNAAQTIQQNRNPFIDYPQFVDCIWGTGDCSSMVNVVDVSNNIKISIYPNSATNFINVRLPFQQNATAELIVFDLSGRKIWSEKVPTNEISIETSSWAKGVYVLKCQTELSITTHKISIQ